MRKKQKIINLFKDSSVRSIKHVISIGDEEDLNQFWHYFHSEVTNDYKLLYRFIGIMYAFTAGLFEKNSELFFELIIEENDDNFYFTIWNAEVSEALSRLCHDRGRAFEYKIDKKRMTIKLAKETITNQERTYESEQSSRIGKLMASVQAETKRLEGVYSFMEAEDKEETLKICDDMADTMYLAKKNGFSREMFIRLRSCLSFFSLNLIAYPQISLIATITTEFSVLMNNNQEAFMQLNSEQITLIEGFVNNMDRWANTLFVSGGADLHFMDRSLKADLEMIRRMIVASESEEELSLDAVFDF